MHTTISIEKQNVPILSNVSISCEPQTWVINSNAFDFYPQSRQLNILAVGYLGVTSVLS